MEKWIFVALLIFAVLILIVQIVTEIIKYLVQDKTKYNLIVFIVSLVITVVTVLAASEIADFNLTWYIVVAAIAAAFFVAYGAMFGYDKLIKRIFVAIKEAINSYNEVKTTDIKEVKHNEKDIN